MKSRYILFIAIMLLLTACNFSLAEDITPPSNYVPPTPMPMLGPLYPPAPPDIENGAAIYAEKCVECHGPRGMGDGEKGKQLPVTVAALGLPQVGQVASPAEWYAVVTRGNLARYMPPFNSLTDGERWDVVAYVLTLHVSEKDLKRGAELYEAVCADCPTEIFRDQERMAALSNMELAQLLREGTNDFPALDSKMTEGGFTELAAYVRTLSFASSPTPEPVAAIPSPAAPEATPSALPVESASPAAESGTPIAEETPLATESAVPTAEAVGGKVTGTISGENVAGLTVTLRGFDHASDAGGPQEVLSLEAVTDVEGNFVFEEVELPTGRIFYAEAKYEGVAYGSELAVVPEGASEVTIPIFRVYPINKDFSAVAFDQVHFFVSIGNGAAQVIGVYTFSNAGEETIVVESATDVPFIKFPAEAQNIGFDVTQDSAPLAAAETGFAIPPSETAYGIVAFYTLSYDGKAQIAQPFSQRASSVLLLVPDGVKVKSDQLTEGELQNFQGQNYREFRGQAMQGGDTLTINLSGNPKSAGSESNPQQNLLIGIGALGLALILAGAWMYLRDRNRVEEEIEEDEEENGFESEEEILDAIIALDDLHRAGKIPEEAYRARREELKERLKQ